VRREGGREGGGRVYLGGWLVYVMSLKCSTPSNGALILGKIK
jgi:hypothetical protein